MDLFWKVSPLKTTQPLQHPLGHSGIYFHQIQKQQYVSHARTQLEHVSQLDIDHDPGFIRHTTIGCTLGELWNTDEMLTSMVEGGMNILRLNLTMGSHEYYSDVIKRMRAIELKSNYRPVVGIAVDISPPPLRSYLLDRDVEKQIRLKEGQRVKLAVACDLTHATSSGLIYIDCQYFPSFIDCIYPGDLIYLDDGIITLLVIDHDDVIINCEVKRGGLVESGKRVDVPNEHVYLKTFETSYMRDLAFAAEEKVDYVFTGYASHMNQLIETKNILGSDIKLFARVETREAVTNLEQIMAIVDGIVVGRNGLGLVFPTEKVFQLQKQIIAKCNIWHKPVFVISQLLESMRFKPRATRAEISDVANAVLDGADGLVLTVETSRGIFPREALKVLHKTCREAEAAIFHEKISRDIRSSRDLRFLSALDPAYLAALAAVEASTTSHASAIFVVTTSGHSASAIASFRPACPVIAIMRRPEVARFCHLFRGVHPFVHTSEKLDDWSEDMNERLNAAIDYAKSRGFVFGGDQVVVVTGWKAGSGATNTVRVLELPRVEKRISIVSSEALLRGQPWFD